ncbi:MAG: hypothetical protein J6O49_15070 [Bacteroidaceae bacterium]|nr:hypothetical protein [Bacteroidaceae bacterium]
MAFILDKSTGKGTATVKITPDGPNSSGSAITSQLQIQVRGVTKAVVQLKQKAAQVYKVFVQTDVNSVGAGGGDIKVTYWVTLNGQVTEDVAHLSGTTNVVNSGTDAEGKHWVVDRVPANSGGVTYTATFNDKEATASVTQSSLEVNPSINNPYVSGEGGSSIFSYWAVENGNIVGDNLELVFEAESSDDVTYTLGTATKDSFGKVSQSITLPANTINEVKELKFHARHIPTGSVSDTVTVSLMGKDMTVLPDFDFFTFGYEWEESAGRDLDSATLVEGSGIQIAGKDLGEYFVGFGGNGNSQEGVENYLHWGGDNTSSGSEGAFINWKSICDRDLISEGITKLYAYIYGNWYGSKDSGNMTLVFQTYKGTGMVQDGYVFKPDENTELVSQERKLIYCKAFSSANAPGSKLENVKNYYSLLATIEYDVATSNAVLKPSSSANAGGRSVTAHVTFNGSVIDFGNAGSGTNTVNIAAKQSGTPTLAFSNAVEVVDDNTGVHNNPMYCTEATTPSDWLHPTFNKDSSGNIISVTFQADTNTTGASRSTSISFKFKPSVRSNGTGQNTLIVTFTQAA